MAESRDTQFSELVGRRLPSEESQSLWIPVAQELDRAGGGPDAAHGYLEAERQRLEKRVESLLAQAKGQLGR